MAFSTGKTSALQTAVKAAVDLAIAELNAGFIGDRAELDEAVAKRTGDFTAILFPQVEEDNATYASSGGGYSGGSSHSAGASNRSLPTVDEAKNMVLNFGAFKGLTLGQVVGMTADEVKKYTGGKQKSEGRSYVEWMTRQTDPKAQYSSARAIVVLADYDSTTAGLNTIAQP